MSTLSFKLLITQNSTALYGSTESVPDSSNRSQLYYFAFLDQGAAAPDQLSLDDFFNSDAVSTGTFVFVEGQQPAPQPLFDALSQQLTIVQRVYPRLAWCQAGGSLLRIDYTNQAVSGTGVLPFGRWAVVVGLGSQVAQGDGDQLVINSAGGDNPSLQVQTMSGGSTQQQGSEPAQIVVPLSGAGTGGLLFDWQWQHLQLQSLFGGELRLFFGGGDDLTGAKATAVRYPLLSPPTRYRRPILDLDFKVSAHPMAPLDGSRTRLAFAPTEGESQFNNVTGIFMRTPTGACVTLVPVADGTLASGAGFGFAVTAVAGRKDLYLTPVGTFQVTLAADQTGVQVMGGTSGSEFVLAEPGDLLVFENNRPAWSPDFDPATTKLGSLNPALTTSWVQVVKASPQAPADDKFVTTSYCAQASGATYFARHPGQASQEYPVAVGISLSQLTNLPPGQVNPFFPLLPHGGVFATDPVNTDANYNPSLPASIVGALETQVTEPARRATLEPTFNQKYGPIFFDAANNTAFQGGSARTPMGFIAELNASGGAAPAGTWKTLQLAQSPQNPEQYLELTANADGVVNPKFSNTVLRDNLFMVVTDRDVLWPQGSTGNEVQLGDFTFQVNIGPFDAATDPDQPRAMAVFKMVSGVSFVEMVSAPDRWTTFFGGGDDPSKVQAQINDYLKPVVGTTIDPLYAAFGSLVNDPNWTGVLFFNCPLDYAKLPSDIQILLGGIDGTLRAHHFGVTINRIQDDVTGALEIQSSSLFAVIDYQKAFAKPVNYPAFQVLMFKVEYENSKLVVFNSRIAFSINTLFGNLATLTIAPVAPSNDPEDGDHKDTGTIVIDGAYTLHEDGTGSLVFDTHADRLFTFPADQGVARVLTAQSVSNAALVPVTSVTNSDNSVTATAAFRLDGKLVFASNVAGDLFSFGTALPAPSTTPVMPEDGLVLLGYAFSMVTHIPPTEGPAKLDAITTDLTGLKVDQGMSKARDGSFKSTFPSLIDSLMNVPAGLGTTQQGAWQVVLGGDGTKNNAAPTYMLGFKIPMGSLGGLVSSTGIVADFYAGWVPGGATGQADKVGCVLVLPASVSGPDGFNVQGIIPATFDGVYLDQVTMEPSKSGGEEVTAYVLRFQHYSGKLVGIPLTYDFTGIGPVTADSGPKDLGVFGSPSDPSGENSMWFVGNSADRKAWNKGPKLDIVLFDELPTVFIGRTFAIETDPTNPNVIDDAIDELNSFAEKTVAEMVQALYASSGLYNSSAGMTFALKFEVKPLSFAALFHDNDFYGAKITLKLEKEKKKKDDKPSSGGGGDDLPAIEGGGNAPPAIEGGGGQPQIKARAAFAKASRARTLVGDPPAAGWNPYEVLNVDKDATQSEIERAKRTAYRKYHPDKNDDPEAKEKFLEVTRAYEIIGNPEKRAKYDADPEAADEAEEKKMIEDKKKKGLGKFAGFEFSIIYRKISDHLGVWSATIYVDMGKIEVGAGSLTLPDFSVSIWTNGDWRFSVGWPLSGHPIGVEFMLGPVPVTGKLGFYLAKLSSEDAPGEFQMEPADAYPPNFKLIWSFGLGISAGVGKKWESGPLKASASLSLVLTAEGFLASFSGSITDDGVDYYWWAISLGLVGQVKGEVDFKIISAELSISLSLTVALALESYHSTVLELTFKANVKASIKIVFVTIHFSFSTSLTLARTTFGSGPDASMSGPSPKAVQNKFPTSLPPATDPVPLAVPVMRSRSMVARAAAMMAAPVLESMMVEAPSAWADVAPTTTSGAPSPVSVQLRFVLQSTAITTDNTNWVPQGVASLVIENDGLQSPFGLLATGIGDWLVTQFGDYPGSVDYMGSDTFAKQLNNIAAALADGQFDPLIDTCLAEQFRFSISGYDPSPTGDAPSVAIFPMHPCLALDYKGTTIPLGQPLLQAGYLALVQAYFEPGSKMGEEGPGAQSMAGLVFYDYIAMLAKQLVTDLQQYPGDSLADRLPAVLANVGGFVSRFLLGGARLPDPQNPQNLVGLYQLTHQQFPLDPAVLTAGLSLNGTPPAYLTAPVSATAVLQDRQVLKTAPTARTWTVAPTQPLAPLPVRYPMNASVQWTDSTKVSQNIYMFADSVRLGVEQWQEANPGTDGPWLNLQQVSGSTPDTTTTQPYTAAGALVLPLSIKTIPKPGGAPGDVLPDIFSLIGTDEAHRACLQALLDDPAVDITSLDLAISGGQGQYTSVAVPDVLVRTNLSTSAAPTDGGGLRSTVAQAAVLAGTTVAGDYCANYAWPQQGGDEFGKFLRLVWECSIVHTGGFYLQLAGLTADQLSSGTLSLRLIVRTGAAAQVIEAQPYLNAMIGAPPTPGSAVMGSLMADSASATPVVKYSAAYPGGNAGWTIQWDTPPVQRDAGTDTASDFLAGLYQMVSYRVIAVDKTPVASPWSRPVTGLTLDGSKAWTYQASFPTSPLIGSGADRYAATGKEVQVEISVEDLFGNSMPGDIASLPVVYNDDLMGLANWPGTQSSYQIQPSAQAGKAAFSVNLSYGSIPFSLGDFADVAALAVLITAEADPVSALIFPLFPADVQATLKDSTSTPSAVQIALITGLNSIVQSSTCVYNAAAFAAVVLRQQTKDLLALSPTGIQLTFLNRLLLEDAYPTAILPEIADTNNLTRLQQALSDYQTLNNQLQDTRVSAEITTGAILAPAGTLTGGVLPALQSYASQVVAWLTWLANDKPAGPVPLVPQPIVISFQVDQTYPMQWDGDLRELQVALLLQRSGVLPAISALAPQVQSVTSPVKPVQSQSTSSDPSGLSAFALGFELAYNGFDGQPDGVVKVASGVNSDLSSSSFGMQSLWLARWGKTSGMSVQIIKADQEKPVFYAPPPLSTQLITREVSGLTDYTQTPPASVPPQIFSGIDMDRTAASFLSAVENIFTPQMAPRVAAQPSQPSPPPVTYDAYVGAKSSLASSIASQLASIYVVPADAGDPASARETMRQALLQTLENDYGIAALVQMAVQIGLHGTIEPGATTPPNLYGTFSVNSANSDAPQGGTASSPYTLSPATLPIKDGKGWLNFLFSVQDQASQNAMTLDLDYQMGFIEHHIDDAQTKCGYTPSEWLTFVLQQNQKGMPQGQDNTLTAPAGPVRIPIPLRSYPPLPKLMLASATQDTDPNKVGGSVADFLTWSYQLNTTAPVARQDTLNLVVTFNEPPAAQTPATLRASAANGADGPTGDLFDALARFSYAYPALEPAIDSLATDSPDATAPQALAALAGMAKAVAAVWPDWTPPTPPTSAPASNGPTEVWSYAFNVQTDGNLNCTSMRNGDAGTPPPWPLILGYNTPTSTDGTGTYTLTDPETVPSLWQIVWQNLYVLDYQSARASAFTERNSNLGNEVGETTNPAFIYRTETVSMPAPSVPLIKALNPVSLGASTSLKFAVTAMIAALHSKPGTGLESGAEENELKVEGAIFYSFELLANEGSSVRSYLPLFLMQNDIAIGGDEAAAQQIASNISTWFARTSPSTQQSAASFRLTIYATKITTGDEHLPLVQFQSLLIAAPNDTPGWWQS